MTKKAFVFIAISLVLALSLAFVGCKGLVKPGQPSVSLNKDSFAPNEPVSVTFTAPANLPPDAWVGIIPSTVPHGDEATNDQYDLTYQYLNAMTSGVITLYAPNVPGAYDVRMHDTDNGGKEIASVSFTVQ